MALHITQHAVERYQRRVEAVCEAEAIRRLSSPSIERAASIGASSVILPSGHKVILIRHSVITVKPKHKDKRRVHRG